MSKNRSSCPRGLEEKLNREVHSRCPICEGLPLVRAHTIKKYIEVKWDYDYLLAICIECEKKVEAGVISRDYLHDLKNTYKKSFSMNQRGKPFNVPQIINNNVILGNNRISSVDIIFAYQGRPMLWFEDYDRVKTLNARFYDFSGTVIAALDRNMWTADRERFYDIKVEKDGSSIFMEIIGKRDDTRIKLIVNEHGIIISESKFYIPGILITISKNGELSLGGSKMLSCNIRGSKIAFNFRP